MPEVQAIVIRHDTGYQRHIASESSFPAVFFLEQRAQRRICVATLISPQWALTAAHCTEETALGETLAQGQTYPVQIGGQQRQIAAAFIHPDYQYRYGAGSAQVEVDLALLRLQQPLTGLRAIPLYREFDEQNKVVTLLGWGYFGIGTLGVQVDDGRFRMARNIIHTAASRLWFSFDDPRLPDSRAVELEGLPGLGDSGGPALIDTPVGLQLAGIAIGEQSAAGEARQGRYGAQGVYERISLHQRWIDEVMSGAATEPAAAEEF
ncbi:MAG: trypsin-like serine protease [Pseudomonadales bacterium]|nr:trypsin-like serine protease [Pseudomonadales bacterium]